MISLIFSYWMTKQKMAIYIISMVIISALSISFMQRDESPYAQILYREDYQSYYEHMTLEYLSFIYPLMIVMMAMHHESKPLQMLYAYFSRSRVTIYKMLSYLCFTIWTSVIATVIIYCLPTWLTIYYRPNVEFLISLMMLMIENLIILCAVFIMISQKHRSFAIFISIFTVIFHMLVQDNFNTYIYYIYPIFNENVLLYKYSIIYQLLYLGLCLVISYMKMTKKEIT